MLALPRSVRFGDAGSQTIRGANTEELKDRARELRPACLPLDPASWTACQTGRSPSAFCGFPTLTLPVGFGQTRSATKPPVLVASSS